jgi:hypothetical protein
LAKDIEQMKKLSFIRRNDQRRWVGDGFHSYNDLGKEISPFLLLDYAGPENFPPSEQRRGVGAHPHRGFETVTIVYNGEVEHRDSSGGGGIVRPGDVQWMTAASGLVHEEFHGSEYAKRRAVRDDPVMGQSVRESRSVRGKTVQARRLRLGKAKVILFEPIGILHDVTRRTARSPRMWPGRPPRPRRRSWSFTRSSA